MVLHVKHHTEKRFSLYDADTSAVMCLTVKEWRMSGYEKMSFVFADAAGFRA